MTGAKQITQMPQENGLRFGPRGVLPPLWRAPKILTLWSSICHTTHLEAYNLLLRSIFEDAFAQQIFNPRAQKNLANAPGKRLKLRPVGRFAPLWRAPKILTLWFAMGQTMHLEVYGPFYQACFNAGMTPTRAFFVSPMHVSLFAYFAFRKNLKAFKSFFSNIAPRAWGRFAARSRRNSSCLWWQHRFIGHQNSKVAKKDQLLTTVCHNLTWALPKSDPKPKKPKPWKPGRAAETLNPWEESLKPSKFEGAQKDPVADYSLS